MNCEEFRNNMPGRAFWPDWPGLDHAARCAPCRARLDRERELAAGFRALAAQCQDLEAPRRVEARLVAAFRQSAGIRQRRLAQRWWVPVLAWGSAAAAVACAALMLLWQHPYAPVSRVPPGAVQVAMVSGAEGEGETAEAYAGGFIPLPNTAEIAPNETVDLVRLEVPRSAMLALGLSVSAEQADETVEADVMLGADGVARAVRFVDE